MKLKAGDVFTVRACTWNEGWEFGAPLIIYSPFKRYCETGSRCPQSLENAIDDAMIDCCIDEEMPTDWDANALREFEWRGWSPRGFARRKKALHAAVRVEIYEDADGYLAHRMGDAP